MWNPLTDSKTVRTFLGLDLDDDEPTRWDSPSRTSRLWGRLTRYPILTTGLLLFVASLILYVAQFIPIAHRNPLGPALAFSVVLLAGTYIQGRKAGLQQLQALHLHVDFLGDDLRIILGEKVPGEGDANPRIEPLRELVAGGAVKRYERFRDRFSRAEITQHARKFERAGEDGKGKVRDGINPSQTADAQQFQNGITLFNEVTCSHAGKRDEDLDSKNQESTTTLAPTVDARRTVNYRRQMEQEVISRKKAEDKAQQMEDYATELEEYVDPAGNKFLEALLKSIRDMKEMESNTTSRQPDQQPEDPFDHDRNGHQEAR
ncbi:MAG: hypothetical protein ACI8U4_003157 [Natronomonas sp.]|jgi:hypothetical protein